MHFAHVKSNLIAIRNNNNNTSPLPWLCNRTDELVVNYHVCIKIKLNCRQRRNEKKIGLNCEYK